jgi:AcrR family transcriptional regulator
MSTHLACPEAESVVSYQERLFVIGGDMPRVTAAHEREVRERIVLAALRVFGEKSFHRATIQDVVRESGLSVGAIYTHFRSKDDLFLAGCDLTSGRGLGELAQRLAAGGSTAERIAIAIAFFFDSMDAFQDLPGMSTFLVQAWAEAEQEPAVREMLVRRREQLVTAGRMLLEEGIARGELAAWIDPDALARATMGLLDGLVLQRIEAGRGYRRDELEERARAILELLLASASVPERPSLPSVAPRPYPRAAGSASGRRA